MPVRVLRWFRKDQELSVGQMAPMTLIECLEYFHRDGDNNPKYWHTEAYNIRTGERIPLSTL